MIAAIASLVILYIGSFALCLKYGPKDYKRDRYYDDKVVRTSDHEDVIMAASAPIVNTGAAIYYIYRYYVDKEYNDEAAKLHSVGNQKRIEDIREQVAQAKQARIRELERALDTSR
jgi:hypothetical protein